MKERRNDLKDKAEERQSTYWRQCIVDLGVASVQGSSFIRLTIDLRKFILSTSHVEFNRMRLPVWC